jgi:hypothetical protein
MRHLESGAEPSERKGLPECSAGFVYHAGLHENPRELERQPLKQIAKAGFEERD